MTDPQSPAKMADFPASSRKVQFEGRGPYLNFKDYTQALFDQRMANVPHMGPAMNMWLARSRTFCLFGVRFTDPRPPKLPDSFTAAKPQTKTTAPPAFAPGNLRRAFTDKDDETETQPSTTAPPPTFRNSNSLDVGGRSRASTSRAPQMHGEGSGQTSRAEFTFDTPSGKVSANLTVDEALRFVRGLRDQSSITENSMGGRFPSQPRDRSNARGRSTVRDPSPSAARSSPWSVPQPGPQPSAGAEPRTVAQPGTKRALGDRTPSPYRHASKKIKELELGREEDRKQFAETTDKLVAENTIANLAETSEARDRLAMASLKMLIQSRIFTMQVQRDPENRQEIELIVSHLHDSHQRDRLRSLWDVDRPADWPDFEYPYEIPEGYLRIEGNCARCNKPPGESHTTCVCFCGEDADKHGNGPCAEQCPCQPNARHTFPNHVGNCEQRHEEGSFTHPASFCDLCPCCGCKHVAVLGECPIRKPGARLRCICKKSGHLFGENCQHVCINALCDNTGCRRHCFSCARPVEAHPSSECFMLLNDEGMFKHDEDGNQLFECQNCYHEYKANGACHCTGADGEKLPSYGLARSVYNPKNPQHRIPPDFPITEKGT